MYKKVFILLNLFLITRLLFSQGGWFWQSPLPQGNNLNNSYWVNSSTVYVAGDRGTIIKSTNKGISWQLRQIPTLSNLQTIRFFTPNIGIAAGSYGTIYRTKDGGVSWNKIDSGGYASISASHFFNASSGYLLVSPGDYSDSNLVLLKTTDSGISWKHDTLSTGFRRPFDFKWFSADTIYVLGQWNLYKSVNHGMNWISIINANYYGFNDMYFLNSNTGWIASSIGHIKKTTDGGISWDSVHLNLDWNHIKSLCFSDESNGLFSGDWNNTCGVIYKTQDGGASWNKILTTNLNSYFNSISFFGSSVLSVGTNGVIYNSSDFGMTWDSLGFDLTSDFENAYFADDFTGWVIGGPWSNGGSIVRKTTDGGFYWDKKYIDSGKRLRALFFLNERTGWVGNEQKIFKTTNAGFTWNMQFDSISTFFNSICFVNELTGWAASEGIIYKTTNGGFRWYTLPNSPQSAHLYFLNENIGWGAGGLRRIFETTNGGVTWQLNTSIERLHSYLYKIHFFNEIIGITCGDGGVFRTSNGGTNWHAVCGSEEVSYLDFCILSNGILKAIGTYGSIITSKDSGLTWDKSYLPATSLNSIYFSSVKTGWVVGRYGVILKTTTGGDGYTPPVIPEKYFLYQNYPNPFNNSTKIRFDIPDVYGVVNAKLYVYDILGREVIKLFDDNVSSGSYSISWNASDFASGIYFYRLTARDYSSALKMVLVK